MKQLANNAVYSQCYEEHRWAMILIKITKYQNAKIPITTLFPLFLESRSPSGKDYWKFLSGKLGCLFLHFKNFKYYRYPIWIIIHY